MGAPHLAPGHDPVADLLREGRRWDAYQLIVSSLGPGVRGYLRACTRSDFHGDELYRKLEDNLVEHLPDLDRWLDGHGAGQRGPRTVRAWIYRAARNLAIDWQRRYSVQHNQPLRTHDAPPSQQPTPTQEIWAAQKASLVAAALAALTDAERDVYVLRHERDFSYAEIAATLEISEAAAKQRHTQATRRLKQLLAHHHEEP